MKVSYYSNIMGITQFPKYMTFFFFFFQKSIISGLYLLLDVSCSSQLHEDAYDIMEGSWVKIRTGTSFSSYHNEQNRLYLGKLIYHKSNQNRTMRNKNKS